MYNVYMYIHNVLCNNILHHFKDEWLSMYNSIKKMCKDCQVIKRRGVLRDIFPNPKHKQKQG